MSVQNNYIAIMAGGIGSRFWPESKTKLPKQFLDLLGTGSTLIQSTYKRFKGLCPDENIFVITNKAYVNLVKEQLPELDEKNIIIEPFRRNTAPTAAFATSKIRSINPHANMIFSPSDQLITDERSFERNVYEAFSFLSRNPVFVTFGIKPNRPETSFGYIQYDSEKEPQDGLYKVKTFTEKPNLDLARTFLKSGDFLWNSGIIAWNAEVFMQALEKHLPDLFEVFDEAKAYYNTATENATMERLYTQCTNVSIDYGLMERVQNVYVIPSYFGWTDLGNWEAVYDNVEKDYLGNAVLSKNVLVIDANECLVKVREDKLAVLQGLENFIIIDTDNVLLICHRENKNKIKEYIAEVKRNFGEKYL